MYIGIDIGGTFIKHAIVDSEGVIIEKSSIPTSHEKEQLMTSLVDLIKNYQRLYPTVLGVGISAPGVIQSDGTMTTAGSIKSIYGINLKKEIEQQCSIITNIENDANAAAIAEKWIGNAQELDNYICLVLGTGIGGGTVINGELFQGSHGMAGEFGWMIQRDISNKGNIETASFNQRASVVGGLCHQYQLELERNGKSEIVSDAREIFDKARDKDPIALKVLSTFYQDLSIGLINLISSFDPQAILIGGAISSNHHFIENLNLELTSLIERHESLNYIKDNGIAKIIPTKLLNDAGLIGAVYQVHKLVQNKKRKLEGDYS